MKIITPQVNQTGEVRLLGKLLNQKVDTVCCICSRGKTLTVQGLWVCKKTGSWVEMHLQALELLTFRYAYKTVLNQSKQKKRGWKKAAAVLCGWTLTPTLLFTHLLFMSSHYHQLPPCCLTPSAFWSERERWCQRKNKKKKRASGLKHNLHMALTIRKTVFDRFLIPLKNMLWSHLNRTLPIEAAGFVKLWRHKIVQESKLCVCAGATRDLDQSVLGIQLPLNVRWW